MSRIKEPLVCVWDSSSYDHYFKYWCVGRFNGLLTLEQNASDWKRGAWQDNDNYVLKSPCGLGHVCARWLNSLYFCQQCGDMREQGTPAVFDELERVVWLRAYGKDQLERDAEKLLKSVLALSNAGTGVEPRKCRRCLGVSLDLRRVRYINDFNNSEWREESESVRKIAVANELRQFIAEEKARYRDTIPVSRRTFKTIHRFANLSTLTNLCK